MSVSGSTEHGVDQCQCVWPVWLWRRRRFHFPFFKPSGWIVSEEIRGDKDFYGAKIAIVCRMESFLELSEEVQIITGKPTEKLLAIKAAAAVQTAAAAAAAEEAEAARREQPPLPLPPVPVDPKAAAATAETHNNAKRDVRAIRSIIPSH